MPYPRFQRSRTHKFVNVVSGNLTLASANIVPVDTSGTGAYDLTLDAQIGDVLVVSLLAKIQNQANGIYFNAATMNGSTPIRGVHGGTLVNYSQVASWFSPPSVYSAIGGSVMYTVTEGDIINISSVTLRPYYTTDDGVTGRVVEASVNIPLQFSVRNIGPADPT